MTTLDLRGVRCPMNLLKVKLALEGAEPGESLRILLDPGEPMRNVRRAVEALGHVVRCEPPAEGGALVVVKSNSTAKGQSPRPTLEGGT